MISQHLINIQAVVTDEIIRQQSETHSRTRSDEGLANWQQSFCRDGGWYDIDLPGAEQDGEIIRVYLQRVLLLACEHYRSQSKVAAELALEALQHWYRVNPQNWNWWWNQIGKQRLLGPIALLLSAQLPSGLKAQLIADFPTCATMTGANKADLAHAMAFGALLSHNENRFHAAMVAICDTICVTEDEGIQADYSYQQHGPQLQNGGYGESFYNVALPWCYATHHTPFAFPVPVQSILRDYFLLGSVWMTRNGQWDYNVCGRAVAKPNLEKPFSREVLGTQARMLKAIFPQDACLFDSYLAHLNGEPYPFTGYKHFWRSDYAVSVSDRYAVTVKANSERTNPIETGNQENLFGYWLGFGSMNIGVNGDEYRNLFPMWDWRRVPGVTNPQVAMPAHEWGRVEQQTHWTGGVSNSRWGIFTFELNAQQTQALKSWFFFGDMVVALGAGISSTHSQPVVTTLNQCRYQKPLFRDNIAESGALDTHAQRWLHHGDIGYVLHDQSAVLKCETRFSSWRWINQHLTDKPLDAEVFELTIHHGVHPSDASYQYTLLPDATVEQTRQYADAPKALVVSNSKQTQAVVADKRIGCVFYAPATLSLEGGLSIQVDQPCVLACENEAHCFSLSVATPGRSAMINIVIVEHGCEYQMQVSTASDRAKLGESVHRCIEKCAKQNFDGLNASPGLINAKPKRTCNLV
ncbi:chondroitinase [Vibrio sp. JPW-9-11-11]|uniref:polysaccharide lyase family 8 super-sandwich domain-containing protein n=1 Tax=Vibrio sp. JPW-9-11-11 TaxID=1416532 RepID=UPI0015930C73|nr:polysaccharide lyase family 8 super-sandwich domain-containing protein [Vibrio sp. JPW-9-11-11]NVD06462.1 chondroitinase [Vibrio sp. JPW-9-11-11]